MLSLLHFLLLLLLLLPLLLLLLLSLSLLSLLLLWSVLFVNVYVNSLVRCAFLFSNQITSPALSVGGWTCQAKTCQFFIGFCCYSFFVLLFVLIDFVALIYIYTLLLLLLKCVLIDDVSALLLSLSLLLLCLYWYRH